MTAELDELKPADAATEAIKECVTDEIIAYVHKLIFKAIVLLEGDLNDSQKALERKNFISDFHSSSDKFLTCTPFAKKMLPHMKIMYNN